MTKQPTVWALLDDRQGNNGQTLGVAEALGWPFVRKQLTFARWIDLPGSLMRHTTLGLTRDSAASLHAPWPDIVIGTGRRQAIVAAIIKARHPASFLVQIQWPGSFHHEFGLIASPVHDGKKPGGNVVSTLGAPNRITDALLTQHAAQWRDKFAHLPKPHIALLVGGDMHGRSFTPAHAQALGRMSSAFAASLGGSLLVTTSRRTSEAAAKALMASIDCPVYYYDWRVARETNPYFALLGLADAIVVTGDSVSMVSEACTSGKPVYIHDVQELSSRKHQAFHQALYKEGLAKPLAPAPTAFFAPAYRLHEAEKIAAEITRRIS